MVFCQSDDTFDVLFLVLHVVALIVGAHQPYSVGAIVKCCIEFFEFFCCSDLYRQTDYKKEPMLMDIIQYFLNYVTTLYQNYCWLLMFVCKYIPLRQWAFDDSHSPKYQKFKVDQLPKIVGQAPLRM